MASIDGLKGFPEAITQVFPKTGIQLCIVHQIRNSLRYVVSRDQKTFMQDLKLVYKATSKEMAEHHLLDLGEKWGKNTLRLLNPGKLIRRLYLNILSILKNCDVWFTLLIS